jgi:DNA-binding NarL/FixJ family response regulator
MEPPNKLSIVIADDHPVCRVGLREIIESEPDFKVVGEAGDGERALEIIRQQRPAIASSTLLCPSWTVSRLPRHSSLKDHPSE